MRVSRDRTNSPNSKHDSEDFGLVSLCSSLFWELRDNGVVKDFAVLSLKARSHVRILTYQKWAILQVLK